MEVYGNITLYFELLPRRKSGLSFSTHRGSRLDLMPGEHKDVTFKDEVTPVKDLISWYDTRYKCKGLVTRVPTQAKATLVSDERVDAPLEQTKVTPLEIFKEETPLEGGVTVTEESSEEESEDKIPVTGLAADSEGEETTTFDSAESGSDNFEGETEVDDDLEYFKSTPEEEWNYQRMNAFVKSKNLEVRDRSKDEHARAITEYMKGLVK